MSFLNNSSSFGSPFAQSNTSFGANQTAPPPTPSLFPSSSTAAPSLFGANTNTLSNNLPSTGSSGAPNTPSSNNFSSGSSLFGNTLGGNLNSGNSGNLGATSFGNSGNTSSTNFGTPGTTFGANTGTNTGTGFGTSFGTSGPSGTSVTPGTNFGTSGTGINSLGSGTNFSLNTNTITNSPFNASTTFNSPSNNNLFSNSFSSTAQQKGNQSFSNQNFTGQSNPPNSPYTPSLSHSYSTNDLNSYTNSPFNPSASHRQQSAAPLWVQHSDSRFVPSHLSNIRQQNLSRQNSVLNGTERSLKSSSSFRRSSTSPSQSPPNTFGGPSFGTPKPLATKKSNNLMGADLPPLTTSYDIMPAPHVGRLSSRKPEDVGSTVQTGPSDQYALESSSNSKTVPEYGNSVVVLGFPPELSATVISEFSRFGDILENVSSTSGPMSSPSKNRASIPIQTGKNWIRITYADPKSASRALNENGTLLAGQYAIGCIAVTPQNSKMFAAASEKTMMGDVSLPVAEEEDSLMDLDNGISTPPVGRRRGFFGRNNGSVDSTVGSDTPPSMASRSSPTKPLPRTISMPALAGAKRIELRDGQGIFANNRRRARPSPLSTVETNREGNLSKGLKSSKPGWFSWTTRKAHELVFGWDDL